MAGSTVRTSNFSKWLVSYQREASVVVVMWGLCWFVMVPVLEKDTTGVPVGVAYARILMNSVVVGQWVLGQGRVWSSAQLPMQK